MPANGRPPAFLFYPRDFLTSQSVAAMSLEQVGAYALLLCHAWLSDQPGTLPDDPHLLAALSRANLRWPEIAVGVLAAWRAAPGKIIQPYMVEARAAQHRRHQRSVQGGKSRASGERDSMGRLVSSLASRPTPGLAFAVASAIAVEDRTNLTLARSPRAARLQARIPAEGSVSLPTNGSGQWQPTQIELDAWSQAYPAMDVAGTMLEMRAWLIANPERRKTMGGMARFVNRWLSKEQNRAGGDAREEPTPHPPAQHHLNAPEYSEEERAAFGADIEKVLATLKGAAP